MKTTDLINKLVDDLQPVRPLGSDGARLFTWLAPSVVLVAGMMFLAGIRADFTTKSAAALFWFEAALVLGVALAEAVAALRASIPGRTAKPFFILGIILLGGWGLIHGIHMLGNLPVQGLHAFDPGGMFGCAVWITGSAVPLVGILFALINRAAPTNPKIAGLFAGLSGAAFAAFGMVFICDLEHAAHILAWHGLPILLCGVLAGWAGNLLKKT